MSGNVTSSQKSEVPRNRTSSSAGSNISSDGSSKKSSEVKKFSQVQSPSDATSIAEELPIRPKSRKNLSTGHPDPSRLPSIADIPKVAPPEKSNSSYPQKNQSQIVHSEPQSDSVSPREKKFNSMTETPASPTQIHKSDPSHPSLSGRPVSHPQTVAPNQPTIHPSQSTVKASAPQANSGKKSDQDDKKNN